LLKVSSCSASRRVKKSSSTLTAIALLVGAALSACSSYTQPALPRRATIESADSRLPTDELRAIVDSSDILYLPVDRLELDEQNGAALRLLNLLHESAPRVALAWANINAATQPLFEQWNGGRTSLDTFLDGIRFASASQREAARRLLREAKERGVSASAVACDAGLGCTADNVAREFRTTAAGKLLVVIERSDLDPANGVPFLVAQRLQVKQVVLDARSPARNRERLLTRANRAAEIVDAAPGPGQDRL
jgi:hypothetical protein